MSDKAPNDGDRGHLSLPMFTTEQKPNLFQQPVTSSQFPVSLLDFVKFDYQFIFSP